MAVLTRTVGDGALRVDIQNYTTRGCHLLLPLAKSSGIQKWQKTALKLLLDHSNFICADRALLRGAPSVASVGSFYLLKTPEKVC